jgi:integrase
MERGRVVQRLASGIRHSTARNAWAVLTGALKAAYAARDRSLRVLSTPLHFGVLPPKRGASRQRPWLYPSEWAKFAACAEIPVAWRQLCAIALYTGLRPGELRSLLWSDVDLVARTISISKAYDLATKSTKAPKTINGQRVIPIQQNLVPLLEALRGKDSAEVIAFSFISEDHAAPNFRAGLETAKIRRPRLTADNATEEPIDFRSLRDTHATWLALEGVADKVIQRRMGHASPTTTDRYVKAAETFAVDNVGVPFPMLPVQLLVRPPNGPRLAQASRRAPKTSGKSVARARDWTFLTAAKAASRSVGCASLDR